MRIGILNRLLFTAISCVIISVSALHATHIVGGEFNYRYLGANQYEIRLTVYRDCYNGIPPFDNPASVGIYDAISNVLITELFLNFTGSDTIPPTVNSPCFIPPTNICYERTTYIDTVILPPSSGGYILSYQRCCRNITILNITSPDATGATFTARIPGTSTFSLNSNPRFVNWPPPFICSGIPFTFDHSAIDLDGDSIVYELCAPFNGGDQTNPVPSPPSPPPYADVNWSSPYSAAFMLDGTPTLSIDPVTGILTCTPTLVGQFVVGVCAKEFRNGLFQSITKRDFQLNVVPCPTLVVAAIQQPIINCKTFDVTFLNYSLNAGSYLWDFGLPGNLDVSTSNTPTFTYPDTGTYTVTLIAYSSINPACADTTTGTVTVLPEFTSFASFTRDTCTNNYTFKDSSNTVSGIITTRTWFFGDGSTSTLANPTHLYTNPGSYTVTLIANSNRGCTDTVNFNIIVPQLLTVNSFTPFQPNCFGDCNGSLTVNVTGGNLPFQFLWSDNLNQTTLIADSLCGGNYSVTITDSRGCTLIRTSNLSQPTPLSISTTSTIAYCNGACIGTATSVLAGGNGGYQYQWNDPANQITQTAVGLCTGMIVCNVIDSKGCTISDSIIVQYSDSLPSINASVDDTVIYIGQSTTLHAIPSNISSNYSWIPSNSLNNSNSTDPISTPLTTTNYQVTVTDENGCSNSDSVKVTVLQIICDEPQLFLPNAFSPNNDGENDVLFVRGNFIETMYLAVYNRWGELVFESNDRLKGWDGKFKDQLVDPGVFVYYLEITCFNQENYFKKGNITVIR
jgi:gliding motility-associated-like protein